MSDGSTRKIKLTPMIHDGIEVVELNDSGHISYMGLYGTTTNGTLMVKLRDVEEMCRHCKRKVFPRNDGLHGKDQLSVQGR